MKKSSHPGGITGGLFGLFDIIGGIFFFLLIGSRATRDKLLNTRVTIGSILFCTVAALTLFLRNRLWFSAVDPSERSIVVIVASLSVGVTIGMLLGAILVGYVESIKAEEERQRREAERREKLIAQGKDPDAHCFVASFAFDSAFSPEVVRLRLWRDTVLVRSRVGFVLARSYHRTSPYLVRMLAPFPFLKRPIRWLLRRLLMLVGA